jgi:hypothetical protein
VRRLAALCQHHCCRSVNTGQCSAAQLLPQAGPCLLVVRGTHQQPTGVCGSVKLPSWQACPLSEHTVVQHTSRLLSDHTAPNGRGQAHVRVSGQCPLHSDAERACTTAQARRRALHCSQHLSSSRTQHTSCRQGPQRAGPHCMHCLMPGIPYTSCIQLLQAADSPAW